MMLCKCILFSIIITTNYFITICDAVNNLLSPIGKKKSFNYNEQTSTCEEISVPMCRNMPYNNTRMPNKFNHETQQDAALEVKIKNSDLFQLNNFFHYY